MYICSVCIEVKRFRYKSMFLLDYQRAGVSFSAIYGTVTISCLSTFDLYCLLNLFVLSLLLWT